MWAIMEDVSEHSLNIIVYSTFQSEWPEMHIWNKQWLYHHFIIFPHCIYNVSAATATLLLLKICILEAAVYIEDPNLAGTVPADALAHISARPSDASWQCRIGLTKPFWLLMISNSFSLIWWHHSKWQRRCHVISRGISSDMTAKPIR